VKQKVIPGGEIDAVSGDEFQALVAALTRRDVVERVRAQENGKTDATGFLVLDVYFPPLGMEFRLSRVVVEADGFSYAVMFTNAAGSVTIQRNAGPDGHGQIEDGYNLSQGLPNTWTAGSGSAPRYISGEKVTLVIIGGPANVNVNVRIQGDVMPERKNPSA
jgi:hypothetical protein